MIRSTVKAASKAVAMAGIAAVALLALSTIGWVGWLALAQPMRITEQRMTQSELLLSVATAILTALLVGTTFYYTKHTRRLVDEARASREEERVARITAERSAHNRRIEGAAAALVGASSDIVAVGTALATLMRHRRVWRASKGEAAMQPVTAASRALDQLRYLAPRTVTEPGEALFDSIVEFYQAATTPRSQHDMEAIARRIYTAKLQLQADIASYTEIRT